MQRPLAEGDTTMDLKNIGFYTLSDARAMNSSKDSQLMRCELILTDACNFKCPYCRGLREDIKGTMPLETAKQIVSIWAKDNLENIRFSGGEPTIYPGIIELVAHAKALGVKRIAISTNGSADMEFYEEMIAAGVNDFSISLDACCASYGDKMAGGINGIWSKVVTNIHELSKRTYVSVGVVLTEDTIKDVNDIVKFAHEDLGVSDIRIIPSAQFNAFLDLAKSIDQEILDKNPILKYRVTNIINQRHVRGLQETDNHRCPLVLDDMAIAGDYHFPCVIYMREQGDPVGLVGDNMREEREAWMLNHDTHQDPICSKNCLDVCIDYNNKWLASHLDDVDLAPMSKGWFTETTWEVGSVGIMGIDTRYASLTSRINKVALKAFAIGWTRADNLLFRPKADHVAVMYKYKGKTFWSHMRNNEFLEVFGMKQVPEIEKAVG
jgi:MoaA/NifB/PqqE/SkfB family radical SAM enzyme